MQGKSGQDTITRRAALSMGAGFMLPLAGRSKAVEALEAPYDFNLFAFRAPKSHCLVFAVTFVRDRTSVLEWRQPEFRVRLHVNRESWVISGPRPLQTSAISRHSSERTFAGPLPELEGSDSRRYNAVVLESQAVDDRHKLEVWAEFIDRDGLRFRVGSPLIAELVAGDTTLSKMYQASSPDQDRDLLWDAFRERIAVVAAAGGGVANPDAHGRRLAALLIPDVLSYRPTHPAAFTFANRNGRHPADDTAALVSTLVKGVVTQPAASMNLRVCQEFPYLLPPMISA